MSTSKASKQVLDYLFGTHGTHGHRHCDKIDGDDQSTHRDLRVKHRHAHARSNVRGPTGDRSHPVGRPLPGVVVTIHKVCVECHLQKPAAEFRNHAVSEDLRRHDGFNIRCRDCQAVKYSRHGYKLDDFVVDDDSDDDSDDSDTDD